MNKKSQISIFILLAIIIIFLFVFLINTNFDEKKQDLEKEKVKINAEDDTKINLVKSKVDYCLEKNLNRALIISGLRGGFIYSKGESYFPGTIPSNTYRPNFISNMDLNWNNIGSRVLVHAKEDVYTPGLEYSKSAGYNHSIRDDIIDFVSIEFMNCLDFEDIEDSYEITYFDYSGNIKNIDWGKNLVLVNDLDADIDDRIKILFDEKEFLGEVKSLVDDEEYLVEFENSLLPLNVLNAGNLKNLSVINLDKKIKLNLTFNAESVRAHIDYPITIRQDEYVSTFEGSEVVADIRYEKLLDLSRYLLVYKTSTIKTRATNYLDNASIKKALEKANSEYFKKDGLEKIEIRVKVINETLEHKKYVYTFIDYDSLILGNPFVFNFGYENVAPIINFQGLDSGFILDSRSNIISMIAAENSVLNYDLNPETVDYQYWDDYNKYFVEEDYSGPDADFSLDKTGKLSFKAKTKNSYTYTIRVTDGEAYREYTLMFLTGFPDNTNNQEAVNCFRFYNYDHSFLPMYDGFKNKIWSHIDSGKHILYGYHTYSDLVEIQPSQLYFSKACMFVSDNYEANAIFRNKDTGAIIGDQLKIWDTGKNGMIEVPKRDFPVEVSVEVKKVGPGSLITEPFVFTVYPADCLGPYANDLGAGDMTCCDLTSLENSAKSNNPKAYTGSNSNLFGSNGNSHLALDGDFYFAVDFYSPFLDYLNTNIWTEYGSDVSSLFEGTITANCEGEYSSIEKNIDSIDSGSYINREIVAANFGFRKVPIEGTNLKLKMVDSAGVCEFGMISNTSLQFLLEGDLTMVAGLKSQNTLLGSAVVSMIPDRTKYEDVAVLCDDKSYAWDGSSWSSSFPLGLNGGPNDLILTKKYCAMEGGTPKCGFRTDIDEVIQTRKDSARQCTNYYVNAAGEFANEPAPSSWVCDSENKMIQCKNSAGGIVSEKAKGTYDKYCSGSGYGSGECKVTASSICSFSPDCPTGTTKVQSCP